MNANWFQKERLTMVGSYFLAIVWFESANEEISKKLFSILKVLDFNYEVTYF